MTDKEYKKYKRMERLSIAMMMFGMVLLTPFVLIWLFEKMLSMVGWLIWGI